MRRPQSSVDQPSVRNGKQIRCSIRARKWHAEPPSRTARTWVGYAADTRNVVKGRTATSRGGAVLDMLVMPLAKTALGRERMPRESPQEKRDHDRRDKPVLHCIPSIIPARRGKSP